MLPIHHGNRFNTDTRCSQVGQQKGEPPAPACLRVCSHKKKDPINVVVIDPDKPAYTSSHYYFDRYTGDQITGNFEYVSYADASSDQLINEMVYDLHFGSILGLPGRLLMFLASLIAASLPITGFIVWWGKRKK